MINVERFKKQGMDEFEAQLATLNELKNYTVLVLERWNKMDKKYNLQESDYDSAKAQKLYGDKTVEELDEEWEKFKRKFKTEHND